MLISHAQNFEDVILWRALKHVESGFYIDIGANDPNAHSVSLAFYERDWHGVHVEPVPAFADKLRAARPDEIVIEAAVSEQTGSVTFYEIDNTGLSTGCDQYADTYLERGIAATETSVPARTLASIFEEIGSRDIHWLKVDVEGMEGDVLRSWGSSKARPWILVIEATLPNSQEQNYQEWESLILERGYSFAYFDGLNRYYVHQDHNDLLEAFGPGPNVFDSFCFDEESHFAAPVAEKLRLLQKEMKYLSQQSKENTEAVFRSDAARRSMQERTDKLEQDLAHMRQKSIEVHNWNSTLEAENAALAEENRRHVSTSNEILSREAALRQEIAEIYRSTSWRLTTPIRAFKRSILWVRDGVWAWLTLKPGSRPRRILRRAITALASRVQSQPRLAMTANRLMHRFPKLRNRLRAAMTGQHAPAATSRSTAATIDSQESRVHLSAYLPSLMCCSAVPRLL